MLDFLELLSTTGESYWDQKEKLVRVRTALTPHVPTGARLVIRENDHDFGPYPSLGVSFDPAAMGEEDLTKVYALEELALKVAEDLGVDF